MIHGISAVRHLSQPPYDDASPVKVTYEDGSEAWASLGSDVGGGGVKAFLADGGEISPYVAPPATSDDVTAERDRRLGLPFEFQGKLYQRGPDDLKRISGAGTLALAAIVTGAQPGDLRWHGGDSDFAWIAADNSPTPMDAQTVLAFGQACATIESLHVHYARELKDWPGGVPENFKDDVYWP